MTAWKGMAIREGNMKVSKLTKNYLVFITSILQPPEAATITGTSPDGISRTIEKIPIPPNPSSLL